MDLKDVLGVVAVIAIVVFMVRSSIDDARKDRAQRRSSAAGRDIVYDGVAHRPRSALWTGLVLLWLGGNAATAVLLVGYFPGSWRMPLAAGTAVVAVTLLLLGVRSLTDHARTEHVAGRVLQRHITYHGEDDQTRQYWIAVDDGSGVSRIRGTAVSRMDYERVVTGATVRLHVTPRGRQVKFVEVLALPGPANEFPGEHAALFPRGVDDLKVAPARAAAVLGSPVELAAVPVAVAGARRYVYVPAGTRLTGDRSGGPYLQITEADEPDAAAGVDRLAAERGGKSPRWRSGDRGVIDYGSRAYVVSWGRGVLVVEGHGESHAGSGVSHLAYTLKPPKR